MVSQIYKGGINNLKEIGISLSLFTLQRAIISASLIASIPSQVKHLSSNFAYNLTRGAPIFFAILSTKI